ncbi:MAG: sodium:alanine symporter family protein [Deltaproteobacteria bacterium]|nr:sodium:alanine symporter family protein [Deltaproteobacteria bacterium]
MLETIERVLSQAVGFIWNWPVVMLCLGGGLYFTVRLGFIQFRGFPHALKVVAGRYDRAGEPGAISHYQALSAALSATVGLGNIAGVAIAVKMGGPGAVFWMWMIGLLGMATKFTECGLATHFRTTLPSGEVRGGPMYYIVRGLGARWRWLAILFSTFCVIASFGIGDMFQSNQTAQVLRDYFGVPVWVTGGVMAALVALVIIGGIRRIGQVAGYLVPFMCATYVIGAGIICLIHFGEWCAMLGVIVRDAFSLRPLVGGSLGAVIIIGVRRALFSSESGFGSAPIAHAAARSEVGMRQGFVALLEPFIDTIVVCSATASVILLSGTYLNSQADGVSLTVQAFDHFFPGFGSIFVSYAVTLFAFSTAISWSYYGEVSAHHLFGERAVAPYKWCFVLFFFIGAIWTLTPIMNFSDVANALMLIPNVLVLFALSNVAARLTGDYFAKLRRKEFTMDPVRRVKTG